MSERCKLERKHGRSAIAGTLWGLVIAWAVAGRGGALASPPPAAEEPAGVARADREDGEEKGGSDREDAGKDSGAKADGEGKEKTTVERSPEEEYVRSKLKDFLSPTELEFLEDGRVKLVFDFSAKNAAHEDIFTRIIGNKMKDPYRWTTQEEELVIGGIEGIRISDSGVSLLRAWFEDSVEAEMEYRQYINQLSRHVVALVFQNAKLQALGSNFGNQCCMFSRGRLTGKTREEIKGVVFDATAKIKLKVQDGAFEAHRDGYLSSKQEYPEKSFQSGQVGFLWTGSVAGIIGKLTVTGKLDYKAMEQEMKKKRARRRR